MFRRILIANRGEVAVRVLRTARRLGIHTVAVAAAPDAALQWLAEADTVAPIGGRRAYLDADALIAAAEKHRCSAVHPGWGFLSENPGFAARCEAARLSFVGPSSAVMRRMADKAQARATMTALGLLPIPGWDGIVPDVPAAERAAEALGYPVLLKAVAGGGGRGMRRVREASGLAEAFGAASAEARSAFGNGDLYMEKLIEGGRHIEYQIVSDGRKTVVLGHRECSIQRRHQKLIEETPSLGVSTQLDTQTRARIEAAVNALGYRGAGTIEMLLDRQGHLWFMEMNTRLQVEHTITEVATGVDLVEWQLRVAANQPLGDWMPQPPKDAGHVIECRINAEDPRQDFRPSPGQVTVLRLPTGEGIRVDTHLREGDHISPHYDSMFAKLIASGPDRPTAIARMQEALGDMRVSGVNTTIALHQAVLAHPRFASGDYDTAFLEAALPGLLT